MWNEWRKWGSLPRGGGWLQQPLAMLVKIQAIDMVYHTWMYIKPPGKEKPNDWSKLTATQAAIARWLEARDGDE